MPDTTTQLFTEGAIWFTKWLTVISVILGGIFTFFRYIMKDKAELLELLMKERNQTREDLDKKISGLEEKVKELQEQVNKLNTELYNNQLSLTEKNIIIAKYKAAFEELSKENKATLKNFFNLIEENSLTDSQD